MARHARPTRTSALALLAAAAFTSGCVSRELRPLPPNAVRPVVAISSFENRSGVAGTTFPRQWNLGSGMAELLLDRMIESEQFVTVERLELDQVVNELTLQNLPLFRPEGRAQLGRLLNAKYLVRGTITEFSQVSGGSFWAWLRGLYTFGKSSTARVALSLTIVDVASGEILGSVQSEGYASAYEAYVEARYAGLAFGGDAFFQTPLGLATRDAIEDALIDLSERIPLIPWQPRVAAVRDDLVVINGGRDRGLTPGLRFKVRESPDRVTDPVTGNPLTEIAGAIIGEVEIIEIRPRAAVARIVGQSPEAPTGFERGQWLELDRGAARAP